MQVATDRCPCCNKKFFIMIADSIFVGARSERVENVEAVISTKDIMNWRLRDCRAANFPKARICF